ncbi:MAG TPA: PHP-associated domain-containing protein [Candidatus Hydrogenedentes bacterium]|nr:PHP-associated domain-containing protein [Candidatus Hydrogenedentota bacterium]
MERLKADLHTHSADDPHDRLDFSAEMLIDAVAEAGVDVLAITCHELKVHSTYLADYACRRGVLLIPGIEKFIEGKHVLILNPSPDHLSAHTFAEFRAIGRRGAVFIAPHPYYPAPASLLNKFVPNIDLFDAVEYCSLYLTGLNLNPWAERVAKKHGLPMIGTSDTHWLPYENTTFSWITAERSLEGVLDGIRAGRVEVETRPKPLLPAIRSAVGAIKGMAAEYFYPDTTRDAGND